MAEERLQKILALAGFASRRKAEQLIVEGRVTVNGEVTKELGSKADPEKDHIKVDGTLIHLPKHHVYIALNKPREVVTTVSDPQGRTTVMHLLKGVKERVFPVGRLDYSSEGLLLLTTDGEFSNRITSPAGHVEKVYVVKANGFLSDEQMESFRAGIPLSGRRTAPAQIKLIKKTDNPWYEVRLMEGRQNQIRIMFKHFHRLVEKLRRVKIGFLTLGGLPPGMWRYLEPDEVEQFWKLIRRREAETEARAKRTADGTGEAPRREYPVLPKERFRRPRYHKPEETEEPAEQTGPRGGDRLVKRPPMTPRPESERPAAFGKRPRGTEFEKPPRHAEGARENRWGRPGGAKFQRPAAGESESRSFRGPRGERPAAGDRPGGRPYGAKFQRPAAGESESRPFRGPRGERPASGDRPGGRPYGSKFQRPAAGESESRSFRGPRGERPASGDRPGGRPYGAKFQRPAAGESDARPFKGPRGERPSSGAPSGDRPGRRPYGGPRSRGPRSEGPGGRGPGFRPSRGPKPGGRRPPEH